MSTSDLPSQKVWQRWHPDNLLSDADLPPLSLHSNPESGEADSEAMLQAELSRLRQQAERKGLEQGKARGFEEGKQSGYEEGKQLGLIEGREAAKAEMSAKLEEMNARMKLLMSNMQGSLDNLDSVIPSRLVQLAFSAARSLFGKGIVNDSVNEMLQERIHQLLHDEPLFKENTQLWVSEEDFKLVESKFANTLALRGWVLSTDKNMLPGGCRITSDEAEIDESVETRWKMLCMISREEHQ
jgi:flagellar assembly protein FliH